MALFKDTERSVWSCRLCELPEEDEVAALEDALRARSGTLAEDARALHRYLTLTGYSQSVCAAQLGRSQSSVANRLRLLKLPEDVLELLCESGLTERHARALLRLPTGVMQRGVLDVFLSRHMTVAEAEAYVDSLYSAPEDHPHISETLERCAEELRRLGIRCEVRTEETENALLYIISVEKSPFSEKNSGFRKSFTLQA